jgi:hypothetical protein
LTIQIVNNSQALKYHAQKNLIYINVRDIDFVGPTSPAVDCYPMALLLCRDVLVRALKWMLQRVVLQATYSAGTFTVLLGWDAGQTGEDPRTQVHPLLSAVGFAMRLVSSGRRDTGQEQLLDV